MEPDFSHLFHQSSKDRTRGHPPIAADSKEWPPEWHTTYYKTYPRLPRIALPDTKPSGDFFDLIQSRKSRRNFTDKPLSLEALSSLLRYSCGVVGKLEDDRPKRAHPSGGARFPLEIYPLIFRGSESLPAGVYHYNLKAHALDVLWERAFSEEERSTLFLYPWVKEAAAVFLLTAIFWRSKNKYGEAGYRYILLEGGHIGQNFYLTAEALGLQCAALGGVDNKAIESILDIDGITESAIYALAIGV
jgi:SagB-type dehydrogenase family enzyme